MSLKKKLKSGCRVLIHTHAAASKEAEKKDASHRFAVLNSTRYQGKKAADILLYDNLHEVYVLVVLEQVMVGAVSSESSEPPVARTCRRALPRGRGVKS